MERHTSRSQMYEGEMSVDDLSEGNPGESGRGSRLNSQDSEETALTNGRKTLEEVAARLNDIDGSERAKSLGRRGLVSTARFPFLSNLFNQRAQNNGIVVDEEDANQEDNPIADIFLWRFPFVSLIWFCILQLLFFLFHFCDYSFLTVAAALGLWQLFVDLTLVRTVPLLQARGMIAEELDIRDVVRKFALFNPRLIKRVASTSYELCDVLIGLWKITVYEANMSRVLIVGRFMFIVFFRSISVHTTLYILHMILFTIPVGYSTNRIFADAVADGAHVVAYEKLGSLRLFSRRMVDTSAERARHYYELSRGSKNGGQPLDSVMAGCWAFLLGVAHNFDWIVNKIFG